MTIEKCRELLGKEAENMSDEEILEYLQQTSAFCDGLFEIIKTDILQDKKIPVSLEKNE